MDFFRSVFRDVLIYTIPFVTARCVLYPIVNMNGKMQRQYRKIEEEADMKDRYQKYQNFGAREKLQYVKDTIKLSGFSGLYDKCENYLVPFACARFFEGIIYFTFMRFCLDIMKLQDPFYLLTGLSFFFVSLMGSFCIKFFGDVMRDRKSFKEAIALLSPKNQTFWNQYEVELGHYHAYSVIQGYVQLFTFWYFKPDLKMEIFFYAFSRITSALCCHPLSLLVAWAHEYGYNHLQVLQHIIKKDGKLGLYAGARDILFNEVVLSVVLIPGIHIVASLI